MSEERGSRPRAWSDISPAAADHQALSWVPGTQAEGAVLPSGSSQHSEEPGCSGEEWRDTDQVCFGVRRLWEASQRLWYLG